MDLDAFIAMTQRVVARDGSEEYLPTLALPAARQVKVLDGIPADVDVETAARNWALKTAGESDDYFLAFKITETSFKAVARVNGRTLEKVAPFQAA